VVVGAITEVSGRLRFDLGFRYHDPEVQTWFEESSITLDDASDVLPMVNEVGLEILHHLLREPGDDLARDALAAGTTFEALAAFLDEYWAFFIGLEFRYPDFGKAASLDSTMALAYYVESMRADMMHMGDSVIEELLAKAGRHAGGLPTYSRLLVESAQREIDRDIDEAEALLVRAINTYPERTMALLRLANLHYQHNSSRGRSMVESGREFALVQEMDPRNRIPEVALQWVHYMQGNDEVIRAMVPYMPSPDGESLVAFTSGTPGERDSLLANVDYCGKGLSGFTLGVLTYRDNHHNVIELLEAQACPEAAEEDRAWATLTLAHLTAGIGRWETAREWFAAVPPALWAFRLEYESLALSLPFVPGDEERIREQLRLLEEWHPLDEPSRVDPQMEQIFRLRFDAHAFLHEHLRRYCQTALHARLGELTEARAALRLLAGLPVESEYREFVQDLQAMGEARIAFAQGDFAGALAAFERVHRYRYMVGNYSAFFQRADGRYLRALCLAELGRHREAVGWFDAADEGVEFLGIYTAFGHLGQARSYEALGMREDAVEHYRRFLRLMEGCDPGYAGEVADAAERLQRLEGVS
jgi:tetratricopeptide (TPR) repeat protein